MSTLDTTAGMIKSLDDMSGNVSAATSAMAQTAEALRLSRDCPAGDVVAAMRQHRPAMIDAIGRLRAHLADLHAVLGTLATRATDIEVPPEPTTLPAVTSTTPMN
jgi:hypothetical protein